jgi:hypothetical protein
MLFDDVLDRIIAEQEHGDLVRGDRRWLFEPGSDSFGELPWEENTPDRC